MVTEEMIGLNHVRFLIPHHHVHITTTLPLFLEAAINDGGRTEPLGVRRIDGEVCALVCESEWYMWED